MNEYTYKSHIAGTLAKVIITPIILVVMFIFLNFELGVNITHVITGEESIESLINPSFFFLSLFFLGFFIVVVFYGINGYKNIKYDLKYLKALKHFKTHMPILLSFINYSSIKKTPQNDDLYIHDVDVNVDVPGHGLTNFKGRVLTYKRRISYVSIIVDAQDMNNYIILVEDYVKDEFERFMKKHYGGQY